MQNKKIKVVTIGGGTVGFIVDRGLAHLPNIQLASITSPFDDGGSAGRLRDELGVLPQGDVRRRLIAHDTRKESLLRELFTHRFENGKEMKDHSLGNIILSGAEQLWGKEKYLDKVSSLFGIPGSILPMSLDDATLCTELSDGTVIQSETRLDLRSYSDKRTVSKIFLNQETLINPKAKKAISEADFIVICPGDLYTSLLPCFLVGGAKAALQKAKGRVIFMTNAMTKFSETKDFRVKDFLSEFEKYAGKRPDVIVHNLTKINSEITSFYERSERAEIVLLSDDVKRDYLVYEKPLLSKYALSKKLVRHDSKLSGQALQNIFNQRLYVWDLDQTILDTEETFLSKHKLYNQKIIDESKNLSLKQLKYEKLLANQKLLDSIRRDCKNIHILLTRAKYGKNIQHDKIKELKLEKVFRECLVVEGANSKKLAVQKILKKYNFPKDKLIIVGDSPYDEMQVARDLGINYIRFQLSGKYIHEPNLKNDKFLLQTITDKKSLQTLIDSLK